jgi:hypothetical protein
MAARVSSKGLAGRVMQAGVVRWAQVTGPANMVWSGGSCSGSLTCTDIPIDGSIQNAEHMCWLSAAAVGIQDFTGD